MMKSEDVKIGGHYKAKVNDRITTIRIDAENANGGWDATNLITNKKIRIKSVQRLRGEASVPANVDQHDYPGKLATDEAAKSGRRKKKVAKKKLSKKERDHARAQAKADQANAAKRDEREASKDGMTASERAMAESEGKRKKKTVKKTKVTKAEREDGKKTSCLDAAAQVLADADAPMNTKEMVEAMAERGLWSSDAPTPHATLYSAILREMQKKGDDSRFRKADRGKFELNDAAAASGKKEG